MKTCFTLLFALAVAHAADIDWLPLGSGMNGKVNALAVVGGSLYAGGNFTTAGGGAANCIAQWNGSNWSALGLGIGGGDYPAVLVLAVSSGTLYAAGLFATAGGIEATDIAQWNGGSWSPMSALPETYALAVSGSTAYAGWQGSGSPCVARWNGSTWTNLPGWTDAGVNALAMSGSTLYVGGGFSYIANYYGDPTVTGPYIAQWNGSSWSGVGTYMNGPVTSLTVFGGTLYVGDYYGNVAQWNGSSWSALGSVGWLNTVNALVTSGGTLYAAYAFAGTGSGDVVQWNGSSWSPLSSYFNGPVTALAVSGSTLYAGGGFTTIGSNTNVLSGIAQIRLFSAPVSFTIVTTNAAFGFTNNVFGFDVAGPSGSNVVIQASADLQTWVPLQTNLLGNGPLYFSDSQSTTNRKQFYRAELSP